MRIIVDENVAIVANDASRSTPLAPQADDACRIKCIKSLQALVKNHIIVLDDAGEVLNKYRTYLNAKGQPGVGDLFFKHLMDHQYNTRKIRRQILQKNSDGSFVDFPSTAELATFDPADRIFVALARAVKTRCAVYNAVDSDYKIHREGLKLAGVKVVELCSDCLSA